MSFIVKPPRRIAKTGDDSPARSLLWYVWRMSSVHQIWVCLLAAMVASLSMVPLELQRRIINNAVEERDVMLLSILGATYLGLLFIQSGLKFCLRIYQGWLSESAVRYCREHLSRMHRRRGANSPAADGQGRAVAVIASEIDKLGGFVGEGLSQPIVNLGMLLAILGYMLVVEPLVTAFSVVFLLPQVLVVPVVQLRLNRLIEKRLVLIRGLSDLIADPTKGDGSDAQSARRTKFGQIYANRMSIFLTKYAMKSIVNLLNGLAPLAVLMIGGYLALQGETTIGVVVAFMSGLDRLANPLRELLAYYRYAAQASVQHQMIARWM